MREGSCVCLLVVLVACVSGFGIFSRPSPFTTPLRPPPKKHGALKLCPPGGASFVDAFNLICPMRRRRRSPENESSLMPERQRRSSSMERTMEMCCRSGCDFKDILPLCNPFS